MPRSVVPSEAAVQETSAYLGIAYKIAATGLFAAMSALIKYVSDAYPTGQVVFSRSLFALVPVFLLIRWNGGLKALKTRRPGAHLMRSGSGFTAMFLSFSALSLLPLADAIALGFLAPLLTTAFAALLLKEKVRVYRWSAIVVGFGGMLLMVQPQGPFAQDDEDAGRRNHAGTD
ncbi:MAG TPA: DMT family transporter, partial [Alphaproteobacteria bacterium]|nr:DMT family transporter [Alphaproteobacteria bacterium]